MPSLRAMGAVDAVGIELAEGDAAYPDVPDVARPVAHGVQLDAPGGRRVLCMVIEFEPDRRRVSAKEGEIDAIALVKGAQGQGDARMHIAPLGRRPQRP